MITSNSYARSHVAKEHVIDNLDEANDNAGESGGHKFASDREVDPTTWEVDYSRHPTSLNRVNGWETFSDTLSNFGFVCLDYHVERAEKDGPAYIPGLVHGEKRNKKAVASLSAMVFDLDCLSWPDAKVVLSRIKAAQLYHIVYTTHNHEYPETEVDYDEYHKY